MASTRNKNAGKHPSYDKKGMTEDQIKRKRAYDKKYHATTARKKYRAALNAKNKKAGTYGNGDGKDMSHTKSGKLVKERRKRNRARNGQNGKSTKK
tara:strand:- start:80 stop:367 length:288 start_codon:yes stop_codon:yes gene_type:complete